MSDENDSQDLRTIPVNELDMNLQLTNSVWGRNDVSPELKEKLSRYYSAGERDAQGRPIVTKSSLWGLLGFYTRDLRLGNLSTFNNEMQVVNYYLDMANDFLMNDMVEAFLTSLSRAATILETSQSKGGFLRKTLNTLRQEHIQQQLEPPKKGFFGGQKKEYQGGY